MSELTQARQALVSDGNVELARGVAAEIYAQNYHDEEAKAFLAYIEEVYGRNDSLRLRYSRVVLPRVEVKGAPLSEALELVRELARKTSEGRTLLNVVVMDKELLKKPVTLTLNEVPLHQVVFHLADFVGGDLEWNPQSLVICRRKPLASVKRNAQSLSLPPVVRSAFRKQCAAVVLPNFDVADTPLQEALEILDRMTGARSPNRLAFNRVLLDGTLGRQPVTLKLYDCPASDVADYLARLAGAEPLWELYALALARPPARAGSEAVSISPDGGQVLWKLHSGVVLPPLNFEGASLEDVLRILAGLTFSSTRGGVTLNVVRSGSPEPMPEINLNLREVPLTHALGYVARIIGGQAQWQKNAVYLSFPGNGKKAVP